MQQTNSCTTSGQLCRWAFWVSLFLASFVVKYLIDKNLGEIAVILPEYILVLAISIIYGRLLCCAKRGDNTGDYTQAPSQNDTPSGANPVNHGDCEEPQEDLEDVKEEYAGELKPPNEPTTLPGTGTTSEPTELATVADLTSPRTDFSHRINQSFPRSRRLYYLDHVKIFLTILVVSHHVTCAFGGCGGGSWLLIIGFYKNPFKSFAWGFVLLNQGYFMSLFFFISAYFTPSSYQRKGKIEFLKDKAKRYWIPAFFVFIVMAPLILGFSTWFTGKPIIFIPVPFHAWFLFWLLLFNLAYVHIYGDDTTVMNAIIEEENVRKLPGPFTRLWYGLGICGVGMGIIFTLTQGSFYGMPLAVGSLANDILFFMAGIVARKNGWLERNLKEQIGMPISLLRCMVVIEAVMMIIFFYKGEKEEVYYIPAIIIGGMYCVDVSLAVLDFFQTYMDIESRYTKFFSDAAYTVYIIHPIFIIGMSSVWIKGYESIAGYEFKWDDVYSFSETQVNGGSLTLGLGWLISNILVHAFVWPAAHYLRKLPGFRQIL